jgi:hypothetical protein
MNKLKVALVQGATCGLMLGAVLLVGTRMWRPPAAATRGTEAPTVDVVKARSYQLMDGTGRVRAALGILPDKSTGLVLFDETDVVRAVVGLEPDGSPGFQLFDADGIG